MNPVEACLSQAKAQATWYRHRLTRVEQRQMGVLMIRCSFGRTTVNPVNDRILRRGCAASRARTAPEYSVGEDANSGKNDDGADDDRPVDVPPGSPLWRTARSGPLLLSRVSLH